MFDLDQMLHLIGGYSADQMEKIKVAYFCVSRPTSWFGYSCADTQQ